MRSGLGSLYQFGKVLEKSPLVTWSSFLAVVCYRQVLVELCKLKECHWTWVQPELSKRIYAMHGHICVSLRGLLLHWS